MGVKSTVFLTRAEAEDRYRSYYKMHVSFSDADLEEELERLNDKANGGQGFDNYQITKSGERE
jgi:hypothetical protein